MREIKFRAWDKVNNRIIDHKYIGVLLKNVGRNNQFHYMQYTGLKDKNGKEIYISDQYKWYQPLVEDGNQIYREHISIVTDDIVELYYLSNRIDSTMGVEIIGNVHQTENQND